MQTRPSTMRIHSHSSQLQNLSAWDEALWGLWHGSPASSDYTAYQASLAPGQGSDERECENIWNDRVSALTTGESTDRDAATLVG